MDEKRKMLVIEKKDWVLQMMAQAKLEGLSFVEYMQKCYEYYRLMTCGEREAIAMDKD